MIACRVCRRPAVTIRGWCAACAPRVHADWSGAMAAFATAAEAYQRETGKVPLADWGAFEAWRGIRGAA